MSAIVLYDGYCHYCFYWIRFFYKKAKNNDISFLPISSVEGQKIKKKYNIKVRNNHSLIYINEKCVYLYLEAIENIFLNHSNEKIIPKILSIIPRWLGRILYLYLFSIPSKFMRSSNICVITELSYEDKPRSERKSQGE